MLNFVILIVLASSTCLFGLQVFPVIRHSFDRIARNGNSKEWQQGMAARNGSKEWQQGMAARNGSKEWQHGMAARNGTKE
jgi:hypothetical protein